MRKVLALFNLPSTNERWYSFDYGRCHFICLDTEIAFSPGSDQYRWLCDSKAGDLVQAWKKKVTYGTLDRIFVWLHRPPFSSGPHRQEQQAADLRTHLVPKFEYYKVDVVFSGHEHLYERVLRGGIQYLVTGGAVYGGLPEDGGAAHALVESWDYSGEGTSLRQEWYDATRSDKGDWHHYSAVSVSADGQVTVSVRNVEANLLDYFTVPGE